MDPIEFSPIISHQMIGDSQSLPIISGKYRRKISKYLFQKGTCHAKNSNKKHPAIDVPNFQVIKLMQIFKSKKYVRETFTGMHYHWFLTTEGIEFLRNYLNRPSEIVPNTLTKQPKPAGRHFGGPPGDRPRGPPHFVDGESRFGGDRDGHCGGPPGGPGGDSGGDKGGASADYGPSWVKVKLFSVTESGEPFVADIENMVDIGFDTETTMPKVSREKPRVVIDCYVGWELEVLSATNKEPNPRPVTVVEWQDISPDYDWSKLMPPTKRVRGELVVEPGWKYKPQFFRVWVYPKRDYMLGTEWLDIEVAAADNNFRILLEKGVERWCIFTALGLGPKDPKHSKDPWAFPKAIRFSELLATTNVPPSVVIDILYGRLGHRYLPIGCQQGGLCLKHYISHYAFNERYNRFISSTKDLLDILGPGILLYLTGNTICVVGKPEQDLQLDMVVSFAKRCIINNEEPANLLKVGSEWLQNLSKEQEETEQ